MRISRLLVVLLIVPCAVVSGGCIVGQPTFWSRAKTEHLSMDADNLDTLQARTHNGAIYYEGGAERPAGVEITATKKAGAPTVAAAEEALDAIEVYAEPAGKGVQRLGWRWRQPKGIGWSANVRFDIQGPADLDLDFVTHNGRINVEGTDAGVKVLTHNGRIKVAGGRGPLSAITHNGCIDATYAGKDINLRTHNGPIEALLDKCQSIDGRIATHNGRIRVVVGDAASAMLSCRTHNGTVSCDAPVSSVKTRRSSMSGTLGDGDGHLKLETHNGSIRVEVAG